jgi:hypothetical protein
MSRRLADSLGLAKPILSARSKPLFVPAVNCVGLVSVDVAFRKTGIEKPGFSN